MTENRRLKVFLCHSKDDKLKIRKLYSRLIADCFDVWLDEVKLIPGQDWDFEIKKAVRNSDIVVVCLSNSSTTKEGYIQKEIRFALDISDEKPAGTIFIIPARLEDCSVPSRIGRFQWVDLFEKSGHAKLKEALHLRMDDLNIRFNSNEVMPKNTKDGIEIPILGKISTDMPSPLPNKSNAYNKFVKSESIVIAQSLLSARENTADLFALEVEGNGMKDAMINDGDVIVMKLVVNAKNGEMVAIWLPNRNETMLIFFFKEKDRYRLQPSNPTMKPIYVSKVEPLEIKGKVMMVIRQI